MPGTLDQIIIGAVGSVAGATGQLIADIVLPVTSTIGGITIDVLIDEDIEDTLEVTEHPVEQGAQITDHSFQKPSQITLHAGWSNSSAKALVGAASALFSGGNPLASDYISGIYSQLKALQQSRQPFSITTASGQFDNMLMTSLKRQRDAKTAFVLSITMSCREVILVSTQSTTLPAQSNQADPASTAEQQSVGVLAPVAAPVVNPGGSFPPSMWGLSGAK